MVFIIGEGEEQDIASIKLATKKGRWIRNARRMEKSPAQMSAAEKHFRAVFSGLKTRSLSNTYNCYGMVFACRRTWIDDGEIEKILVDDEYRLVSNRSDVCCGDMIAYRKGQGEPIAHVGIILAIRRQVARGEIEFTVLSQWGGDGEFIHPEEHVPPLFGSYREYYSERRLV